MNQSEFEPNACNRRHARENACDQVMIGLGNQSRNAVKQNQSNYQITFDTQLKSDLRKRKTTTTTTTKKQW